MDEGEEGGAPVEAIPMEEGQEGGDDATVEAARAMARQMLVQPEWCQWAEDMLEWTEEVHLSNVEGLFPEADDFPTRETYRFTKLVSQFPGASFPAELLRANSEEPLDLSKVPHPSPHWTPSAGICLAYACS